MKEKRGISHVALFLHFLITPAIRAVPGVWLFQIYLITSHISKFTI